MFVSVPEVQSEFKPPGIDDFAWDFPQLEVAEDHLDVDFGYLTGLLCNLEAFPDLAVLSLIVNHLRTMMVHAKLEYIIQNHPQDVVDIIYPVLKLVRLAYFSRRSHRDIFNCSQRLFNELLLRWVPSPSTYLPEDKLVNMIEAWKHMVPMLSLQRSLLPPGTDEDVFLHHECSEVKIPVY